MAENSSFIFTVCVKSAPRYHFQFTYVVLQMAVKNFSKPISMKGEIGRFNLSLLTLPVRRGGGVGMNPNGFLNITLLRCTFQILGVSGSEDRGGGDNSIQFVNIGREGDKSFKE